MLTNIESPYYFSGQDDGAVDQWALLDTNDRLIVVDQNFKALAFTNMVLKNRYDIRCISSILNFNIMNNSKCMLLSIRDNRFKPYQTQDESIVLIQEKLMFVRKIIGIVDLECKFHLQHIKSAKQSAKQPILVQQEFFQLLVGPSDVHNIELTLFDADVAECENYILQIKQLVLRSLFDSTMDFDNSIMQIKNKFFNFLDESNLRFHYFDYIKATLNELR